jgi:hypothetical protein
LYLFKSKRLILVGLIRTQKVSLRESEHTARGQKDRHREGGKIDGKVKGSRAGDIIKSDSGGQKQRQSGHKIQQPERESDSE